MNYRILPIGVCLLWLSACSGNGAPLIEENTALSSAQPTPTAPMAERAPVIAGNWQLAALREKGEGVAIRQEFGIPSLLIGFTEGNKQEAAVSGYTGVNRLNTSAVLSASDSIVVSPRIITTRRAGPPEAMALERRFLRLLKLASRYRVRDNELLLEVVGEDSLIRFTREASAK